MSMVKEHQQFLATDANWTLRIDRLKKTHPLKFAKFTKKRKKFRNDCNTPMSEVQKAV
ncbi:hypothetical protein BKA70DRAFT_1451087 [Coprinopsis sp. MPI-PUGE-AT-0042]|nr:hypothetical protein BKA70DRAFT_1451087 [Coprinopsis sp. MPI-PUGE-AT-0042]